MLQKIYVEFYEQTFEDNEQELNDNINDTELESELPHSTIAENYSSKRQMKTENKNMLVIIVSTKLEDKIL